MKVKILLAVFLLAVTTVLIIESNNEVVAKPSSPTYFNVTLTGPGYTTANVNLKNLDTEETWAFDNNGGGAYEIEIPQEKNPVGGYYIWACQSTNGDDTSFVYGGSGNRFFDLDMNGACATGD